VTQPMLLPLPRQVRRQGRREGRPCHTNPTRRGRLAVSPSPGRHLDG
jgi:hypothetical protein